MSQQPRTESGMYSRRELALITIAGLAAPLLGRSSDLSARAADGQSAGGVRLGVQTSSFQDVPNRPGSDTVDMLIQSMTDCDVRDCELFAPLVEAAFGGPTAGGHHHSGMAAMTPQMVRRELRKWRLRTPIDYFASIGSRFRSANLGVHAYSYSPDSTFSDEEIDRGFTMAKALGAEILSASITLDMARRVAPIADKHRMIVALSGQRTVNDPHQIATPADFAAALSLSPYFKVNVDIGQFTVARVDSVAFIRDHHARIASVSLNDRRRNDGDAVVWGRGDAPIREVLQLLKREGWPIPAYVDYEYRGDRDPVAEVKRCFAYAKQALA